MYKLKCVLYSLQLSLLSVLLSSKWSLNSVAGSFNRNHLPTQKICIACSLASCKQRIFYHCLVLSSSQFVLCMVSHGLDTMEISHQPTGNKKYIWLKEQLKICSFKQKSLSQGLIYFSVMRIETLLGSRL